MEKNKTIRPPVVVIMGHIDHGKSTLLDYIRKTNVVEEEAGGITQRISAYEVEIPISGKSELKAQPPALRITFIDTPGHESFSKMRERGCQIADIAILIVSAEDGVKPQTIEVWNTIAESGIPCLVAINKIDKPNANVEKTKGELAEHGIYLESYGGKIPSVPISAKIGTGVEELLSLVGIIALMEGLSGSGDKEASGFVLEANLDSKRGIQATVIIKDGTLLKGRTVVVEDSVCPVNIMENFKGAAIDEASFSSPVRLVGFSKIPRVGAPFKSFKTKKEAEKYATQWRKEMALEGRKENKDAKPAAVAKKIIPILLKADIAGSIEAIEKEINKVRDDNAEFKIIQKGIGPVSESDIKTISGGENVLIIGFNVKADKSAAELAEKRGMTTSFFDIIYKMTEWLTAEMDKRRPRVEILETMGSAKIIKIFSRTKERQIVGGRVLTGRIALDKTVKIMRREFEIGRGKIINLEKNKVKVKEVEEGAECGMMIESKIEIAAGDIIESFDITQR